MSRHKELENEYLNVYDYESFELFLTDKIAELENELKHAEERAAHHAEIARICSATAERYEAALQEILGLAKTGNTPMASLVFIGLIKDAAKEALKEGKE